MRLLFWGDLASTGFGTVTVDLGRAMLARGDDLRFLSMNRVTAIDEPFASRMLNIEIEGGWTTFEERMSAVAIMRERVRALFAEPQPDGWFPDAVLIVGDPATVIRSEVLDLLPAGFPAFHYVPIEGVALPPSWKAIWDRLSPIAMSRFGAAEIAKITGSEPPCVYHGVDTEVFYVADKFHPIVWRGQRDLTVFRSRAECKRAIGVPPEATLLLRADRLMPRKRFPSMLRAVAPVLARHPDVLLLMHCYTIDEGGNLDDMRSHFPEWIRKRMVVWPFLDDHRQGAPREVLATLYNAADIYLSTGAEGFGLTLAEAEACGAPAIGMDFSSVPEVIGPAGVTVPVGFPVENVYSYLWANVDEEAYSAAVERLVVDRARRAYLGALGPAHVRRTFSWTAAAEQMATIMERREAVAA